MAAKRARTPRSIFRKVVKVRESDGVKRALTPEKSIWYAMYVDEPDLDCPRFQKIFRVRFRLPYSVFQEILEGLKGHSDFAQWYSHDKGRGRDAKGELASPIELLLLGVLRYLGRGWTFDDLEEVTCIGKETHRRFFRLFVDYGKNTLAKKHIRMPTTAEEAEDSGRQYANAGFHGAIGSTDATHIPCEKVKDGLKNHHLGHKLPYTSRTYNLTCNNRRRILHTTGGHPARVNDKTLIRFDQLAINLKEGHILDDHFFDLYYYDESSKSVKTQKYRGAWLLVDNGYLKWSITIPPFKAYSTSCEKEWSKWLESLRKDVECTFGILKARWRILKSGVRCHGTEIVDKIWFTCCALHNMLLDADGLETDWTVGEYADWNEEYEQDKMNDLPERLHGVYDQGAIEAVEAELSNPVHFGLYPTGDEVSGQPVVEDGAIRVNSLRFDDFRARLVEHFRICRAKDEAHWPKRRGQ